MKKLLIVFIIPVFLLNSCSVSKTITNNDDLKLLLIDQFELAVLKKLYKSRDASVSSTIANVLNQADAALRNPLYSVTFLKDSIAPSGDKRDYISMGPYWWPDPKKKDGKPYIRKDGQTNPKRNKLKDHDQQNDFVRDVERLALGYYFTGNETYAKKANRLLEVCYVDESTRMNPHLNYGQGIPGITSGRGIGIIETRELVKIPDALALLKNSNNLKPATVNGVWKWFAEYLRWLTTSKIGLEERDAKNNHGTYYDVQVVGFALFTGNLELARKTLESISKARVDVQFTNDGAQPLELERTRAWNYSAMNLLGWVQLATLADKAGVDL